LGSNYSGGLTINAGTVQTNTSGVGTGTVTLAGGTLQSVPSGLQGYYYGGDDGARTMRSPVRTYLRIPTPPIPLTLQPRDDHRVGGLEAAALTSAGGVQTLSYDPSGGDTNMFQAYGQFRNNNIVSRMVGTIYAAQAGSYTFGTTSDDGSMLYVDGAKVVENNVYQGMTRRTGTLTPDGGHASNRHRLL
jgi:hypothetical protein